MPICARCKRPIEGRYISDRGQSFHPECFRCDVCGGKLGTRFYREGDKRLCTACWEKHHAPRCAACGRPITGKVVSAGDRRYHPECFRCSSCGNIITGKYTEKDGKIYCGACYKDLFLPKCAICGDPITGHYYTDDWGNAFHAYHERDHERCLYCGRLICEELTGGGGPYPDGRQVCAQCRSVAVNSLEMAETYSKIVAAYFERRGLGLGMKLPVEIVPFSALNSGHPKRVMSGQIEKLITTHRGQYEERSIGTVRMLDGMPAEKFCEVLAHEYGHAWLFRHGYPRLPDQVEEGVAGLFAHMWLSERGTVHSAVLKKMLEADDDPIYGDGLRRAVKGMEQLTLKGLLDFVKVHKSLP